MGTMEERVYSRSVTKQAMSHRVVDEQQIDRHYSNAELAELYKLADDFGERPVPVLPADELLKNLLLRFPKLIFKYHEHDSLLENKDEEDLSEAEKIEAWTQYEQEEKMKEMKGLTGNNLLNNQGINVPGQNYAANMGRYNMNPFGGLSGGSMYGQNFDLNMMSNYGSLLSQYAMMTSSFPNPLTDPMGAYAMLQNMNHMPPSMLSPQTNNKQPGTSSPLSPMYSSNPLLAMEQLGSLSPSTSNVVGSSGSVSGGGIYTSISPSVSSTGNQNYRSSMAQNAYHSNPQLNTSISGMPNQAQSSHSHSSGITYY